MEILFLKTSGFISSINKFQARSCPYVFMGYPYDKKGWTLYELDANKFIVFPDMHFVENQFPLSQTLQEFKVLPTDETVSNRSVKARYRPITD